MLDAKRIELIISDDVISNHIYFIRGQKVMLDRDLAKLYAVETKVLKQAVKRNIERFPPDFMFDLSKDEVNSLRSQFVTLKRGEHAKYLPTAFTELGVAMLSSVLNSVWPKSPFSSLRLKNNCSFTPVNSAIIFFRKPRK